MKKLIVLATLAALPAVAMADVVISGDIGVAITNTKNKDEGAKTSANGMSRQTGQIVFSGNEALGNGLKAIWQVATKIDPSGTEQGGWNSRDTFIGLSGEFGTVKFGRISTPTNGAFAAGEPYAQIDVMGSGVYKMGEARTNGTISYETPVISGFSAQFATQLRPEATDPDANNHAAPRAAGLGLKYVSGPVAVTYSREEFKDQVAGLKDIANIPDTELAGVKTVTNQASVAYSADDLTVAFIYGDAKISGATGGFVKERGYGVYATYNLGQFTPVVSFWKEGKGKTNAGDFAGSYNVFSLGSNYALSKRTNAGVELQFQGARQDLTVANGEKFGKKAISTVYLNHKF